MKKQNTTKRFTRENGRIYFSKAGERKVFFAMTLVMLGVGLTVKLGIF